MTWTYNPETKRTDDPQGIIPRELLEESVARLHDAGSRQWEIVRVMACLTGLSMAEVSFTVDLVFSERKDIDAEV